MLAVKYQPPLMTLLSLLVAVLGGGGGGRGGGSFGKRPYDERGTREITFHSNWCHPLKIKVIQSSCIC